MEYQEVLLEAACQLLLLREQLKSLGLDLPLPDDLEDHLEHRKPYDMATEMLGR